jgi:hypothetical protein
LSDYAGGKTRARRSVAKEAWRAGLRLHWKSQIEERFVHREGKAGLFTYREGKAGRFTYDKLPANQEVQEEQHRQDVSQRADFIKLSGSNFQADVREQAEGNAFTDTEC